MTGVIVADYFEYKWLNLQQLILIKFVLYSGNIIAELCEFSETLNT